jgi:hypothetical protein
MKGESLGRALANGAFVDLLRLAVADKDMIAEFDRLKGHNLSRVGAPLELKIDDSTGSPEQALDDFTDFVWELAQRLPTPS